MLKPSLNSALHQPSLTALLPLYLWLQGTGASLCALAEVSGLPKSRVSFHRLGWVWLKRTTTEIWVGQSLLIRQRVGRGAVSSEFPPGRRPRWVCTLCCPSPGQDLLYFAAQKHDATQGGHHIDPTPELV